MKNLLAWINCLLLLLLLALPTTAHAFEDNESNCIPNNSFPNKVSETSMCPVTITGYSWDVSCSGIDDGGIDITVDSPNAPFSYQWNNGLGGSEDLDNLWAGDYCVTVTDVNGCTGEACFYVNEPIIPTITFSWDNPSFVGANDGSIYATVNGGMGGFIFEWNIGANTPQITGLSEGTYCVIVTDFSGCFASECVTLTAESIQIEIDGPEELCVNECGTYTATNFGSGQVCGITWEFQGQILSDQSTFNFCPQGFTGGDYLTAIAQNCAGIETVTTLYVDVISTFPLEIVSTSPASCPDNDDDAACDKTCSNSTITYTVPGSQGLDLAWNVVGAESFEIDNNLLTVTWGNPGVGEITVNSGVPGGTLQLHCTALSASTPNGGSGQAMVFVGGGTPPYSYQWCNGSTANVVTGLASGYCSVTVSDANGNVDVCEVLIPEPDPSTNCLPDFMITPSISNVSCYGSNDGFIDFSIGGTSSNFTFLWSNGTTSPFPNNLSPGIYTVTITDDFGCTLVSSFPVFEADEIGVNAYMISPATNADNDGAAGVQAIGGAAPYYYLWSTNGTTASGSSITGLSSGNYCVTITDANDCTAVDCVTIEASDFCYINAYITINELPSSCYNSDGSLQANPNIVFPSNHTYLWDNNATTATINSLSGGTYCVTITDGAGTGCTASSCIDLPCDPNGPATCAGEGSLCIDIIAEPDAEIRSIPEAINGVVALCKGETIHFQNFSSNASNYVWELGNGYATAAEELSYAYTESGVYTVLLIARNECFCIDTTTLIIAVSNSEIPEILCTGTTCSNNEQTYTTSADCATFIWALSANGTITAGGNPTDDFVTVNWGNGPTGYVSVQVFSCNGDYCDKPTTEVIPIIQNGTPIIGPAKICPGEVSIYSLPLWTGTSYEWTVADEGEIKSGQFTNSITVKWDIPAGTNPPLWVHATYENCFLDCSGESHKVVELTPEFYLAGPVTVCENSTSSYAAFDALLNNPVLCNWSVINPAGAEIWTATAQQSVDISWPLVPGRYTLTSTPVDPNAFCNNEYTINVNVNAGPPALTGIDGLNAVCPGEFYTYSAVANQGNVSYYWTINNGGTLSETTGATINVQWGLTPPYELTITQVTNTGLACESLPFTMVINPINDIGLTGPNDICIETTQTYTANEVGNATYEWVISPSDAGTLLEGQGSNSIEVLWNASGTADVSVSLCGNTETIVVNVSGFPEPIVNHPLVLCPGATEQVSTTESYAAYRWENEAGSVISTSPIPTLGPGYYNLVVTNSTGCEGQGNFEIEAYPEPEASISNPGFDWYCVAAGFPIPTLYALNTDDGYTYEWFNNNTPLNIFTEVFNPTGPGTYRVQVTDLNGCTNFSNAITVYEACGGGNGPPVPGVDCPDISNIFSTGGECRHGIFQNTSTGYVPGSILWSFGDPASGINNTSTLENPEHIFTKAGFYNVVMFATSPGGITCAIYTPFEVKLQADFKALYSCPGSPTVFEDISKLTPGTTITNWDWDFGDPASGSNNTATSAEPTHIYDNIGNYDVTLTVTSETGCTSTITKTVAVLPPPSGDFLAPASSCEAIALPFSANLPPEVVSSSWDFGDPASGAANTAVSQNTFHVFSAPGVYDVTLTFNNVYGCSNSFTLPVNVDANDLSGAITLTPSSPICDGNSTNATAPAGGISWLWDNGFITDNITLSEAGIYDVTITDAYGCTYSPPDAVLDVIPNPEGTIMVTEYNEFGQPADFFFDGYVLCEGEDVFLSISGAGDYSYQWSSGQSGSTVVYDEFHNSNLTAGTYDFTVTVTDNVSGCTNVEGPYTIIVNPVPTDINIATTPPGPICEGTIALFEVTNIDPELTYIWSTGEYGTSITASTGGEYFVRGISPFGCEGESNTLEIYRSPDANLIPDGCHTHCAPDTICLPEMPEVATYQWYFDDNPIPAPNGTVADLSPQESGTYRVELFSIYGCYAASDAFDLTLLPYSSDSITLGACEGSEVMFAGEALLPGTTTLFEFSNFRGCDSIVTVTVLDDPLYDFEQTIGTCDGTPVEYNGTLYNAGDEVTLEYLSLFGCDSTIHLTVESWPTYAFTETYNTCTGSTIFYNGEELLAGTTTTFDLISAGGCDSIVTVVVMEDLAYNETVEMSGCEGESILYNGTEYPVGTQQILEFTTVMGCDSTIFLNVATLALSENVVQLSACPGTTTGYNGDELAPGVYNYVFDNQMGCDSMVEVTVIELLDSYQTMELTGCEGSTVTFDGVSYEVGTQVDLLYTNYQGCDSTIALTITATPLPITTIELDICANDSIPYNGSFLYAGTTTEYLYEATNGCDSIVIITLEAFPEFDFTLSATDLLCWNAASGEIIIEALTGGTAPFVFSFDDYGFGADTMITGVAPGQHRVVVRDGNGCEEAQLVMIEEIPPLEVSFIAPAMNCLDDSISVRALLLNGETDSMSYQWQHGVDGTLISVYEPGTYTLDVTNICETRAFDLEVALGDRIGDGYFYIPNSFSPNGDGINDEFTVYAAGDIEVLIYELHLYDRWGNTLYETVDIGKGWDGTLDGVNLNVGVYVWWMRAEVLVCGRRVVKVFEKGDVTVFR